MGKATEVNKTVCDDRLDAVLLMDTYSDDSKKLHTSFKLAGKNYPAVVIDDDGFLPEDVTSVYGYFLGEFPVSDRIPGKPRYFNQITVPEHWEISGTNSSGKIHNLNKERGRIFYAEPKHKRLVRAVDWYDDRGVVRSCDHYNRYGALYARTTFNAKGQKVNRSYFSATGAEIIVENYITKDIILNDGDSVRIFHSKVDFIKFFMERAGYVDKRIFFNTLSTSFFVSQALPAVHKNDILFWQEPIHDEVPGNMRVILNDNANRTAKIMVQQRVAYRKLRKFGVSKDYITRLGYIYPFTKINNRVPEALICTNSDRLANIKPLIEAIPHMHFHIAALTEMSSKLMSLDSYDNVSLYPGVKSDMLDELFNKCDYYLDINYESEIVSAVQTAFLHSHLILGYKDTLHNANYVANEHIFELNETDRLVSLIKETLESEDAMNEALDKQYSRALLEGMDRYAEI
ncbi:MAG: accessory Sec system glycosylation chaperone GtfB [Lachnospiraceae bacterium]|nr:accessory Sec system glycosylation chaperone GtfB [Lachnospiraceae bacterium]